MKTFTQLAKESLQDLVTEDGTIREFQKCRGEEHILIRQNGIEIALGYEPFGPPWCYVDDGSGTRVRIGSKNAMSADGTLEQTHQEQLIDWLGTTRQLIVAYLNKEEAQQVATAGKLSSSLRSGRLFPAVPHFKR